jgi:hypothetical protein
MRRLFTLAIGVVLGKLHGRKTVKEAGMAVRVSRPWKMTTLWALSLVVTAVASSRAQVTPRRGVDMPLSATPSIVSGNDVGFRIERTRDGIQVRKLVLRIDGVWVDTDIPLAAR